MDREYWRTILWIGSWYQTIWCLWIVCTGFGSAQEAEFRVYPYIQNPSESAVSIRWLANEPDEATIEVRGAGFTKVFTSVPQVAESLRNNPWAPEAADRFEKAPYMHSVRVEGLATDSVYQYTVKQSGYDFTSEFRTNPNADRQIRFMVFADSETEPESSSSGPIDWPREQSSSRPEGRTKYLVDQTIGFQKNLLIMADRQPNFLCISGDLVESGGEQRDWDEFWRHLSGRYGKIASSVPIFPAIGNHENFGGPGGFGGYSAEAANFGVDKYLTYFEVPSNSATNPKHRGRYYRIDYGPVALITLDSSDGEPANTDADTNHNLRGSNAPDFNPGSEQYQWLEQQLKDAQQTRRFTFVQFHHVPYGSGPHSIPYGQEKFSGQSGIAMRVLMPLFHQYGVDALFCGHDEMLELSIVPGREQLKDGTYRARQLYVYDIGIGGDGLRGPSDGFENPFRRFLAHDDFIENWEGNRLISGGKHYGHVEVNVMKNDDGVWRASLEMVHAFPVTDDRGDVISWERRVLPNAVLIAP
jgi:hypothetical protein